MALNGLIITPTTASAVHCPPSVPHPCDSASSRADFMPPGSPSRTARHRGRNRATSAVGSRGGSTQALASTATIDCTVSQRGTFRPLRVVRTPSWLTTAGWSPSAIRALTFRMPGRPAARWSSSRARTSSSWASFGRETVLGVTKRQIPSIFQMAARMTVR